MAQLLQADETLCSKHHVVEHLYAQYPPGLSEPAGHREVLLARLGQSGRVVVNKDDRLCALRHGRLEHLSRMNDGRVQRAYGYRS